VAGAEDNGVMFTGIVEELGEIVDLRLAPDGTGGHSARVTISGPLVTEGVGLGDSIAVSGVCLTVVTTGTGDAAGTFDADVMHETLTRTTAEGWAPGRAVNLERSVTLATRLGGHLVQGHVDGVGTVTARAVHDDYDELAIQVPAPLGRFLAGKGAVAVDGVSLTVIEVADSSDGGDHTTFTLGIIPTTRTVTTLGTLRPGDRVNVEADVMAKYAERLLTARMGGRG
jgi:riboflavin synthase